MKIVNNDDQNLTIIAKSSKKAKLQGLQDCSKFNSRKQSDDSIVCTFEEHKDAKLDDTYFEPSTKNISERYNIF